MYSVRTKGTVSRRKKVNPSHMTPTTDTSKNSCNQLTNNKSVVLQVNTPKDEYSGTSQ